MKRLLCLFLIMSAIFLSACSQSKSPAFDQPAQFYYLPDDINFHSSTGVIAYEIRNVKGYSDSLESFITLYLQGPADSNLVSPFPAGLTLEELSQNDSRVQITLSKEFSSLEGIGMTLSCSCLAATIKEFTGVEYVYISYVDAITDKRHTISLGPDTFWFYDDTSVDALSAP